MSSHVRDVISVLHNQAYKIKGSDPGTKKKIKGGEGGGGRISPPSSITKVASVFLLGFPASRTARTKVLWFTPPNLCHFVIVAVADSDMPQAPTGSILTV